MASAVKALNFQPADKFFDKWYWRFLLDLKRSSHGELPELRFRQFADNLRNHAVYGATLKIGLVTFQAKKGLGSSLPLSSPFIIGLVAFGFSLWQTVGLCFYGIEYHLGSKLHNRKLFGLVQVMLALLIFGLFVWSMFIFVFGQTFDLKLK